MNSLNYNTINNTMNNTINIIIHSIINSIVLLILKQTQSRAICIYVT